MNPQQTIQKKISHLKKKINSRLFFHSFLSSLFWACLGSFFIFVGYGLFLLYQGSHQLNYRWEQIDYTFIPFLFPLLLSGAFSLLCIALGSLWALAHFRNNNHAALQGDRAFGLKDRLGTSNYLLENPGSAPEEIQQIIFRDTASQKIDPKKLPGPSFAGLLTSLPLALLLAFLGFTTLFLLQTNTIQASQKKTSRDRASQILKKTGEEIQKSAEKKKLPQGIEIAKALKKAAKEIKNIKKVKKGPLKKLRKKLGAIKKQLERQAFEQALKKAIRALKKSKHTKKIGKDLKDKKFSSAEKKTDSLSKEVKKNTSKLSKNEKSKLAKSTYKAAKALQKTKLNRLAKKLAKIAKALDPQIGKQPKAKGLLGKNAKNPKKMKDSKALKKMLARALKAVKGAEKLLKGKKLAQNNKLPVYKGSLPKGLAKLGKNQKGQNQPPQPPIQPGPMKKGAKGKSGQGKQKIWKGPCDFSCPFSGQCMKCPCRGKKKGICPYTKKACTCKKCASSNGSGGGGAGSQGSSGMKKLAGAKKAGGKGGLKAGKGSRGLQLGKAESYKNKGRKTRLRGRMQKDGKSVIMSIRNYKKEKTSVDYKKNWQREKAASEDALKHGKLPLSKRLLIKKYFQAIKPKEE